MKYGFIAGGNKRRVRARNYGSKLQLSTLHIFVPLQKGQEGCQCGSWVKFSLAKIVWINLKKKQIKLQALSKKPQSNLHTVLESSWMKSPWWVIQMKRPSSPERAAESRFEGLISTAAILRPPLHACYPTNSTRTTDIQDKEGVPKVLPTIHMESQAGNNIFSTFFLLKLTEIQPLTGGAGSAAACILSKRREQSWPK